MDEWKNSFSVFPQWQEAFSLLTEEEQGQLALAIIRYGTAGIEPEFTSRDMKLAFAGVRKDIDNSVSSRTKNKGGRPKKGEEKTGVKTSEKTSKTPVLETENPILSKPNYKKEINKEKADGLTTVRCSHCSSPVSKRTQYVGGNPIEVFACTQGHVTDEHGNAKNH